MARLFTEGGELQDMLFFDGGYSAGFQNVATNPASGSRCYQCTAANYGNRNIPNLTEFYLRFRLRIESIPGGNAVHLILRGGSSGATSEACLTINGSLIPTFYIGTSGGTVTVTGTFGLNLNQYYLFEIYFKMADSPNGAVEMKIDGVSQGTFSGDTKQGADTCITNIQWTSQASIGATPMRIDDLALNDTTNDDGLNDNSWCGDGKVVLLSPNGNGASSQWTGSDGNSTDNYLLVDDVPNNGDTDYVADSVSGHVDDYNLGTFSIPANHVVARVIPIVVSREETAAGDSINLGIISGASAAYSGNLAQTTVYSRYEGNSYKTDPDTGLAWTQAGLDALKVAVKIP